MATLHIKLPCIQQNQNTNTPYKIQVDASNSEERGWLAIPPVLDGSWYIQNIRMCKLTDLSVLYQLSGGHSSEKRGLRSTKCSSEALQNFLYFMYKKTHVVFFIFYFVFEKRK